MEVLLSELCIDLSPLCHLQRFKCSVYRRYNDFVVFHEMLLHKFPYRMVPALPPKRMLGGKAASSLWPGGVLLLVAGTIKVVLLKRDV